MIGRIGISLIVLGLSSSPAWAETRFSFQNEAGLSEMRSFVRQNVPVGSFREQVRALFVGQGEATLKTHPTQVGVEKYIYDINLCSYYVWRWNISANYDAAGKLRQLYINGEPALPDGSPARVLPQYPPTQKAVILKITRPRPEAVKGEQNIVALVADHDADPKTIDDQELLGAGPTRADPSDMGKLHVYSRVEPWRSIFDMDDARAIVPYSGDCAAADAAAARAKPH